MPIPFPMFVASGTASSGSTSCAPAYPTDLLAGDLLFLIVVNKYPLNKPTDPNGWTLGVQKSGGAGAAGADSGNVFVTAYWKVADGTETGNETINVTSGNSTLARIFGFRKVEGANWMPPIFASGESATPDTAWSATMTAAWELRFGDMVAAWSGQNTDAYTNSVERVAHGSAKFQNNAERTDNPATAGDDVRMVTSTHEVLTGNETAISTYTMTAAGSDANSPAGVTVLARLRMRGSPEVHAPVRKRQMLVVNNRSQKSPADLAAEKASKLRQELEGRGGAGWTA